MTKAEAIAAMKINKKVTHRLFLDGEFIRYSYNEHIEGYVTEEGYFVPAEDFWNDRKEPHWLDGWEIFE